MRIATYNIEWMNALFGDDGQLLRDDHWSARRDVTRREQIDALTTVFKALNADLILIVEAPDQSPRRDTVAALENFAKQTGLKANRAVMGFANDTQQELAALFDPQILSLEHAPMESDTAPYFDAELSLDLDIDARADRVVFSKPPLELQAKTAGGTRFRLIGAHLKSKAPHGARDEDDAMRISINNRRKQLAQAIWLRRRVEQILQKREELILLGDLNDGPGLDRYEGLFGRSSVEIVLGDGQGSRLFDPHAQQALQSRLSAVPTSARFWIKKHRRYLQALLDYIMLSEGLMSKRPQWRIWHPFDDPECWSNAQLRDALLTASDHFPVTVDLELA